LKKHKMSIRVVMDENSDDCDDRLNHDNDDDLLGSDSDKSDEQLASISELILNGYNDDGGSDVAALRRLEELDQFEERLLDSTHMRHIYTVLLGCGLYHPPPSQSFSSSSQSSSSSIKQKKVLLWCYSALIFSALLLLAIVAPIFAVHGVAQLIGAAVFLLPLVFFVFGLHYCRRANYDNENENNDHTMWNVVLAAYRRDVSGTADALRRSFIAMLAGGAAGGFISVALIAATGVLEPLIDEESSLAARVVVALLLAVACALSVAVTSAVLGLLLLVCMLHANWARLVASRVRFAVSSAPDRLVHTMADVAALRDSIDALAAAWSPAIFAASMIAMLGAIVFCVDYFWQAQENLVSSIYGVWVLAGSFCLLCFFVGVASHVTAAGSRVIKAATAPWLARRRIAADEHRRLVAFLAQLPLAPLRFELFGIAIRRSHIATLAVAFVTLLAFILQRAVQH
jgi:hypothetical protein